MTPPDLESEVPDENHTDGQTQAEHNGVGVQSQEELNVSKRMMLWSEQRSAGKGSAVWESVKKGKSETFVYLV